MESIELIDLEFQRLQALKEQSRAVSLGDLTQQLARQRNRFVWPLLVGSLAVYFGLLIAVLSLPGWMTTAIYGEMNLGLLAVCLQMALTIGTFWLYCAWAARRYDGGAAALLIAAQSAKGEVKAEVNADAKTEVHHA